MLDALYSIIIFPLYQIVELCYYISWKVFKNSGYAVLCVSFAVSFMCLPLYVIAEKWQELERIAQKNMAAGVAHIKKAFKGDEQYMMLAAFYRQHRYHPIMALRSSISLAIQIPFFIAAYAFLSNLEALHGVSFFFIKDMGAPDALFSIGAFSLNVLPVAMTLINIISGAIYTKGHPLKEKVQIYVTALVFLVLLYNSPAGLVLYWTCNNIFSLVKNIFYKLKRPLLVLYLCVCALALALDWYTLFVQSGFLYRRLMLVASTLPAFFAPLMRKAIVHLADTVFLTDKRTMLFLLSSICLALLCGYTLPSYVISSSPMEFSFVEPYSSPFFFLTHTTWQSLGFCVFWPCCIYFLFGKRTQTTLAACGALLAFGALINAFLFGGEYGTISSFLAFSEALALSPSKRDALVNMFALIALIAAVYAAFKFKKSALLVHMLAVVVIALAGISLVHSTAIAREYKRARLIRSRDATQQGEQDALAPIFHLSREHQNVMLIMLDRAISGFVPYIFEENPDLHNAFDGFIFYPNTASYADHTLVGAPPIFGGYDYTPVEMNKRDAEPLVKKHNEALLTLPLLFDGAGYKTTVTDLSWANYSWIPDMSFFDAYPTIRTHKTIRAYTDAWLKLHPESSQTAVQSEILKRNFIWFSFLKCMPLVFRDTIYDDGFWWNTEHDLEYLHDVISNYAPLDFLPELTDAASAQNTFTIFVNELTHEPQFLQAPDYVPRTEVTDRGSGEFANNESYHVNAAALKRLGDFFDYLKHEALYDNTRIVIVADHGANVDAKICPNQGEAQLPFRVEAFNPLLMIKDFNAHGALLTQDTFMTNADVPALLLEHIFDNPAHPLTGSAIIRDDARKKKIFVTGSGGWAPDAHNANTFRVGDWHSVHDNIFEPKNWQREMPE
ncbi:MAG: YidC/Oxa1 family membrane protein insertase [Treponema sp.]|nr:YidC/Oxa1 family membrane protein insertase [Treponema sp.]